MKLIFLQNSATQPRCHKRYRTFVKAGCSDAVVYSFNRNWYNVNLPQDIKINSLGELEPGSYFRRLILYIRKLKQVFNEHKDGVFYCYGQDMAFVAMLFGKKYVYEESDIMYLEYKNTFVRSLMKRLDLFIQKKALASVFTSQGFVDYLYKNVPDNVFVLPNKLDAYFEDKKRPEKRKADVKALSFAFIGLLRYERMMSAFIKVMAQDSPNHQFHIWGDGSDAHNETIKKLVDTYPQVIYHGPFRNPVDLESIYDKVDINFVCYDTTGGNERIAEPNKLYESTFFNTPMLVSPNTYLSKVVEKWGNGFVLDCNSAEIIRDFFKSLTEDSLTERTNSCKIISTKQLISSVEDVKGIIKIIENESV